MTLYRGVSGFQGVKLWRKRSDQRGKGRNDLGPLLIRALRKKKRDCQPPLGEEGAAALWS